MRLRILSCRGILEAAIRQIYETRKGTESLYAWSGQHTIIGSTVLPQIGMPGRVDSINRPPSVGIITVRASQHLWSKADSSDPQLDCRRSRQRRVFSARNSQLTSASLISPISRKCRSIHLCRGPESRECCAVVLSQAVQRVFRCGPWGNRRLGFVEGRLTSGYRATSIFASTRKY
jgi:hypothetical protein